VRRLIYFPQLEQEQSEPQLPVISISYLFMKAEGGVKRGQGKDNVQLEEPEHPHSPFIVVVLLVGNRTA
jgi:hypothetical protein